MAVHARHSEGIGPIDSADKLTRTKEHPANMIEDGRLVKMPSEQKRSAQSHLGEHWPPNTCSFDASSEQVEA